VDNQADNLLMKRVQEGETAQLALLFERHHLGLFRYLLGLSGNRALSEDLVQEVFFRIIKYARTYDPTLTFTVWLYKMGRNAYFDSQRKISREVAVDEYVDIKSSEPMQEEIMTRKQEEALLQEALRRLPEDKREVLILSRYHDLRYEEIGRILECEAGTVKVRVYRALKELRERFCELRGENVYDV
jgi:RNA polymerase sigma factor (sigma-70 family)